MRRIVFTLLMMTSLLSLRAQSCCEAVFASKDGDMSVFASDAAFRKMHPDPLPYTHISQVGGEMISLPTSGEKAGGYLIRAKSKSDKWLLVYQEWWGLNDHIKKQAEQFYQDLDGKVNVLAMDMYDGKIATTAADAGKYMQSAQEDRLEEIMKGAIAYAGKKARIASVGWCFGGSLSLKSAILEGHQAVGCVMYYGMPVKEMEKLKALHTDVLGLFATEQWISKEVIEEFAGNMKKAGKKLDYKIYDAVHAFANPSNPKYDEAATADAYGKAIAYLKTRLR